MSMFKFIGLAILWYIFAFLASLCYSNLDLCLVTETDVITHRAFYLLRSSNEKKKKTGYVDIL